MANNVLGLIVARGNSKGIPRKNLALLGGRPLIAWTIDAARNAEEVDCVAVSTEDRQIARVASECGADLIVERPRALARDETPTMPVVFDALAQLPLFETIVLLQPTSPLRSPKDIDVCVRMSRASYGSGVVSVTRAVPTPYHMVRVGLDGRMAPLLGSLPGGTPRQSLPAVMTINGAVYAAGVDWLRHTGTFITPETSAYPMPRTRSIDIDDEIDLEIASLMLDRQAQRLARAA